MKKILFFIESLQLGGSEKSLINLLSYLDYEEYDIHLMVSKRGGCFEILAPSHLKIEESTGIKIGIFPRIKYKILRLCNYKKKYHNAQLFWQSVTKSIPIQQGEYDVAIAWAQGFATYFVGEKIKAKKKYAWVNTDYQKAGYNCKRDLPVYNKFDKVVGVSIFVKDGMQNFLDKEKVIYIRDIVDPEDIISKAKEVSPSLQFEEELINIVSVGRLSKPKQFNLSIETAKRLIDDGYKIKWYIIGEGSERLYLEGLIKGYQLQNKVILLGYRENPYPYINACDIYVQTSSFEGLGMTVIEAKILCKPIVSTNFPTASEILENGKLGIITEMNVESVSEGIKKFIDDDVFKKKIIDELGKVKDVEKEKTLSEIKKLFDSE